PCTHFSLPSVPPHPLSPPFPYTTLFRVTPTTPKHGQRVNKLINVRNPRLGPHLPQSAYKRCLGMTLTATTPHFPYGRAYKPGGVNMYWLTYPSKITGRRRTAYVMSLRLFPIFFWRSGL